MHRENYFSMNGGYIQYTTPLSDKDIVLCVHPMLYASPLITLTQHGYTKHYFEEGRRICSKIGGGFINVHPNEINNHVQELNHNTYEWQYQSQLNGIRYTFGHCIHSEPNVIPTESLRRMLFEQELSQDRGEPAFYYHSDHLGSTAYLVVNGHVAQVLNYLPFGEDWLESNNFNPDDTTRLGIYRFNGKEKDYESGFHYYGARYYWSELLTGWLSVDPMADKYPSISPYAYCAWNPVKLVDPDGRDWVVIFDHEKKTVTVNAKYVTKDDEAHASAENAIKAWNNLSGKYSLMVGDEKYSVNFNLSVIDNSEAVLGDPELNAYKLVSELRNKDGEVDEKIMGETNRRIINVLESEKDNYVTSSHEIGHSLGLEHFINGTKGLMEEDGGRLSCCHEITKSNVDNILHLALHPEDRNPKTQTGVGSYKEIGSSKVDITNRFNLRLLKN